MIYSEYLFDVSLVYMHKIARTVAHGKCSIRRPRHLNCVVQVGRLQVVSSRRDAALQ